MSIVLQVDCGIVNINNPYYWCSIASNGIRNTTRDYFLLSIGVNNPGKRCGVVENCALVCIFPMISKVLITGLVRNQAPEIRS